VLKVQRKISNVGSIYKPDMHLPPTPRTPGAIELLRWIFTPMSYMDECASAYGDIYSLNVRPDYPTVFISQDLYPNPEQFKPERFLERQYSAYEFLPFGGGARRCIGLAFAQFEMKLVLARILTSVQLELVTKTKVNAKRRGLVSAPDRPIYINRLS
jgi:hypothetical protein